MLRVNDLVVKAKIKPHSDSDARNACIQNQLSGTDDATGIHKAPALEIRPVHHSITSGFRTKSKLNRAALFQADGKVRPLYEDTVALASFAQLGD